MWPCIIGGMKKMKDFKKTVIKAGTILFVMTILCGFLYTAIVTIIAQVFFKDKANGSIIEVKGVKYGCELLAQDFSDENHMWGRVMKIDTSTYLDKDGKAVMYAKASNLSPESEELKKIIEERVNMILAANSDAKVDKIPEDLVTASGSGLDPDISIAAAEYQVPRLAKSNNLSEQEVEEIISRCTNHKLFGFLGEETVNVLKVNLMLEGIL